jgi:adenylate cyclase
MLKNINISYKLALMVILPILGLIYFTTDSTLEKRKVVYEMDLLQALSKLAVKSSALIHELQKERGISAGFLGSQGQQFSQELKLQRRNTDNALKTFQSFIQNFDLNSFNGGIKANLDLIVKQFEIIETQRALVDNFQISAKQEILAYTQLIESLLVSINYLSVVITHLELANGVMAYVNLLYAKEKAGLERATLNNVLSRGNFTLELYKTFAQLVEAQENYVKDFLFFATPKQRATYHDTMDSEFVDEVEKIRDLAFKSAAKFELIEELRRHIGYGGLLHQLNDYILWGKQQYIDAFNEQYQTAMTIFNRYKNLPYVSASELENLNQIEQTFNTYNQYLIEAIALTKQQKPTDDIEAIIKIDDAVAFNALNNLLISIHLKTEPTYWWKIATGRIDLFKKIEDQLSLDLTYSAQLFKQQAQSSFTLYLTITCITIVLTFILYYIFACGIIRPLKNLVQVAHEITDGYLDIEIQAESKDETGQLSKAMTKMLESLRRSEALQREIQERKRVEEILRETNQAYARFVPNEFLLLLDKKRIVDIQLGNHTEINMTVLFADIRSFTTLSERMSPQDNFTFINSYLKEMGPVIREHGGFIDKYIGDAIMALFIKADDAVQASLAMLDKLSQLNQIQTQNRIPTIKIGIGLNTGKLMLGIIGEQNRLQGTVISDTVNLASRIENLTKTYKSTLIISENTYLQLTNPSQYAIRFLDHLKVKGRSKRDSIFEIFDGDPEKIKAGKLANLKLFEQAVYLYQQQKFREAQTLMQTCLQKNPSDAAAEVYRQRCQNFLKINQSDNWETMAQKLEWRDDLMTHNPIIDEQHKELFDRIKNLIMSIGHGELKEEVTEMIQFLETYVVTHFEIEEMYMQQCDYPHYAIHKAEHTQFIDTFNKIKRDYQADSGGHLYFALRLQQEIVEWLSEHIAKSDKAFGEFDKTVGDF